MSMSKEKFIQDLEKLVAFKTVTGQPEGFSGAIDFIREQIHPNAHIEYLENNGEPILLASNKKTKQPDVCYLVHVDVIAGEEHQFKMQLEGDIAEGRGVSDMKFSIPVGYALLNDLIEDNSELSFTLAITSDEERGGFKGAGYLAQTHGLEPKLLIVPDGGDNFVLIDQNKGVCQLSITAHGKPAHSSRPWEGENAIRPIVELAAQLFLEYGENNSSAGWHTTANIGKISGGQLLNQVPANAELKVDFRFPYGQETVQSLQEKVQHLASQIDPNLDVKLTASGAATFVDINEPNIRLFLQTASHELGHEIPVEGGYGSTDARHFNANGVPFIMMKPEGGDIHGDHEHIHIDSVMVFYKILWTFLKKLG